MNKQNCACGKIAITESWGIFSGECEECLKESERLQEMEFQAEHSAMKERELKSDRGSLLEPDYGNAFSMVD